MTVSRLRREMPQSEFIRWDMYFAREAQERELQSGKVGSDG